MAPSQRSPRSGGRIARTAIWTAATVVLVLAGLRLVVGAIVDEAFVEGHIARRLSSPGVAAGVDVGAVRVRSLRPGLTLEDLRIEAGGDSTRESGGRRREGRSWLLSVPRATVSAVDLLAALGGDLSAAALRMEAPRLLVPAAAGGGSRRSYRGAAEDTFALAASGVELVGLAVRLAEGRTRMVARSLVVDSLIVDVSESVVRDTSPDRGPPVTPVQRLARDSGLFGRIDSLRVRAGRVRYTQRRSGQPGAGEIVFDRIEVRAGPLPLGGRSTPGSDTVRVIARGRVARQAPVWIAASFSARSAGFSFEARGGLTALDLTALNGMFRPVEGIHIESGRLDSLTFRMRVREGRAEGRVEPVYDSLSLTLEDPRDGGTGLDEHVRSIVLGFRLNARNQPADGDDFRTGAIEHRVSPGETFLAFLWRALLSGLRDVAGV